MFIVDSKGHAFGSSKVKLAASVRPGQPVSVRCVRHGQREITPKATPFEALYFAVGAALVGARDIMLVPRW